MENDLKEILQELNYKKYNDIFIDYSEQKIDIGLSNTACRQISQTERPIFSNFGIFLGIIPSIVILIVFSVLYSNYYYLLLLLFIFFIPHICYLLDGFKSKIIYIAYILLFIDLFITRLPNVVTIIYLSFICCSLGIKIWKNLLFKSSIQIMKNRSDTFVWAYNSLNLFIKDKYGITHHKKIKYPYDYSQTIIEEKKQKDEETNLPKKNTIIEEVEEEFICDNCGAKKKCPNCGLKFVETSDEKQSKEEFVCDNCGGLVDEKAKKCPHCGESFEEEDKNTIEHEKKQSDSSVDKKYSDLNKLKELLDKDIITKKEFEEEKKKILNN